jgi:cytochrome c oxidase subunit 2
MNDFPLFPEQASTIAPQVDLLLLVLIAISSVFTLLVVVLIVYFGIRYHRRNRVDRTNAPTSSLRVELGWIFGLLFLAMGAYTWATILYYNLFRPPANTLDIYVIGQQWMWKVQHPQGPSEINELHVPRGRPVRLIMISEDVIHSFYVPAFRIKYDVLPGRYSNLWFEATKTGEFFLHCAEYCGTQHADMGGRVIVMEPRAYQEWLTGGQTGAPVTNQGEALVTELGCSSCHAEGATVPAPSLAGIFGRTEEMENGETVTVDESYLRESILLPQEKIVAGYDPIMPSYEGRVSEEQLLQLIAYIQSLGDGQGTSRENNR